jgi:hypothetical protein
MMKQLYPSQSQCAFKVSKGLLFLENSNPRNVFLIEVSIILLHISQALRFERTMKLFFVKTCPLQGEYPLLRVSR